MNDSFEVFDDFSQAYEAMIDWPRRLANEGPFFRWLFNRTGARKVLDTACGSGHHVDLFCSWGLEVEGADASAAMIQRCRQRWGQSPSRRWVVRSFDQPVGSPGEFDAAICIGNSLSLAADKPQVARAMAMMLQAVRAGGAVVIQILNLWSLPEGEFVWQTCRRASLSCGDSLIIRGVQRTAQAGRLLILLASLAGKPLLKSHSVALLGLTAEDLQGFARNAGAAEVEVFGDYQRSVYAPSVSRDLIVVALK